MAESGRAPQASVLRLSRYHCFLGELLRGEETGRLTSREIAEELGVAEETVRRDLSYIEVEGRPGSGYDPSELYQGLESYLGLADESPFVAVGSARMLGALRTIFPSEELGMRMVACYSELEDDAGENVDGVEVRPLAELPSLDRCLGATVALVACEPGSVGAALDAVHEAGIDAVLMLTPVLRPHHPEGMQVTYFRIPCSLKSLASAAPQRPSCCAGGNCSI
jgi:redox-sensing transcriptional repressor